MIGKELSLVSQSDACLSSVESCFKGTGRKFLRRVNTRFEIDMGAVIVVMFHKDRWATVMTLSQLAHDTESSE